VRDARVRNVALQSLVETVNLSRVKRYYAAERHCLANWLALKELGTPIQMAITSFPAFEGDYQGHSELTFLP